MITQHKIPYNDLQSLTNWMTITLMSSVRQSSTHRAPKLHFSPLFTRDPLACAREVNGEWSSKGHNYLAYAPFLGKAYISRLHRDSVVLPHVVSNAEPLRSFMSDANMRKQLIIHNSCNEHSMESRRKSSSKNIKADMASRLHPFSHSRSRDTDQFHIFL